MTVPDYKQNIHTKFVHTKITILPVLGRAPLKTHCSPEHQVSGFRWIPRDYLLSTIVKGVSAAATKSIFHVSNSPHRSPPTWKYLKTQRWQHVRKHRRAGTCTHRAKNTAEVSDWEHFKGCWRLPCKDMLEKPASFSPILFFLCTGAQQFRVVSATLQALWPSDLLQ